jgi:hypothetical protein
MLLKNLIFYFFSQEVRVVDRTVKNSVATQKKIHGVKAMFGGLLNV